jgi:hypothetical protein
VKDDPRDRSLEPVIGAALRSSLREGSEACPDAEMLAAWSDDGLPSDDRSRIEAHLAGCGRCQSHVAALARATTAAEPRPARAASWLSWRWLVPAAVGATAVALWVMTEPQPLRRVEDRAPAAAKAEAPSTPQEPERQVVPDTTAGGDRAAASQNAAGAKAPQPRARARASTQEAPPAVTAPADGGQRVVKEAAKPAEEDRVAAAPAAPHASDRAGRDKTGSAGTPVIQAPKAALADAVGGVEIVSSDPAVRWRLRGTAVERTVDAGATWTTQRTGTTALLAAGSSPSPDVCWLVGRQGAVLRSIDGRSWQTVVFPEAIDLVRVAATGPDTAVVTTADNRHIRTSDGGKTWTTGGLQEF